MVGWFVVLGLNKMWYQDSFEIVFSVCIEISPREVETGEMIDERKMSK